MKKNVPNPKLADVAHLAGVSNATVSRVLNKRINVSDNKLERVTRAIEQLGYSPNRFAQGLKGAASRMIGMIVPSISDLFFSQCAEAVEIVARKNGYLLIVMASHDQLAIEFEDLQVLLLHHIDGLIISPARVKNPRLYEELKKHTLPVVGLDRPLQSANLPSVVSQNREGSREATAHLIAHGYRKILCVHVKPELYPIQERIQGYTRAVRDAGLESILVRIDNAVDAQMSLAEYVNRGNGTIAVFAANNLAARYTWEAIRASHLTIPGQVAMICFDDFDLSDSLVPPVSVVQQVVGDLGRSAAELLFHHMHDGQTALPVSSEKTIRLPTRLIIRESCGCNPST